MSNNSGFSTSAVATVALMRIKGIGRRAAARIVDKRVETEDERLALWERAARQKIDTTSFQEAWKQAEELLEKSQASGIKAFALVDEGFPARLRNIPDPPAVLFVKGETKGLRERSLAVVGTREPTDYGVRIAGRLAARAADMGFAVVSGLAHGCDTLAHEGCAQAQGIGVAVLAHGLDKVYPASNKALAQRLIDLGGCLVSEYPLGMAAMRTAFAERDRIQSGLSDAVLVIETDVKGGTMHTVNFARQQRRPLACIDHPATWFSEPKVQGNRMMIAERWADAIANGDALTAFLGRLDKQEAEPVRPPPPAAPQGAWDF